MPDLTTALPVIDLDAVTFITDVIDGAEAPAAGTAVSGTEAAVVGLGVAGRAAAEPSVAGPPTAEPPVAGHATVEPDLLRDALLIEGSATTPVTRRAQHHRRRRFTASGRRRVGLVVVVLSAATVAVVAAGVLQGPRADDEVRVLGQPSLVGRDGLAPQVPGGEDEDEDAISPRRRTAVVAREAQLELLAQAVAERVAGDRQAAEQASRSASRRAPGSGDARSIARAMLARRGWSGQWTCLDRLWSRESGWNHTLRNPSSGAFGIPQALPGPKMASAGADWATNPATQIRWGLSYIAATYGTPCRAWAHSQATGWY